MPIRFYDVCEMIDLHEKQKGGYMKNEVVKYGNNINDTALKRLRSGGLDLFMALCALVRDKGVDVLSFDYATIKNLTGLSGQKNEYVAKRRSCRHHK